MRERSLGQTNYNPFYAIEREEADRRRRELLTRLSPILQRQAETLSSLGIPVDKECRIDMRSFSDIFDEQNIKRSEDNVLQKEKNFKEADPVGELMEQAVTLAFNQFWFKSRLLKVRASRFDDINHQVDELIIDKKTGQVLAAVDDATSALTKEGSVRNRFKFGDAVKFGIAMKDGKFSKKELSKLPHFIIQIHPLNLEVLAADIARASLTAKSAKLQQEVALQLLNQAKLFQNETSDPEIKRAYKNSESIFAEIIVS